MLHCASSCGTAEKVGDIKKLKTCTACKTVQYCSIKCVDVHHALSVMYHLGEGVEKDEEKKFYHLEEAAIGGHPKARHNLGYLEWKNGRLERAVKHWIIAANLGYDDSLYSLTHCYKDGMISKEDFAAALRAHQAAVDATKSPQREAAEAALAVQNQ
jgi:TPR repeat protein